MIYGLGEIEVVEAVEQAGLPVLKPVHAALMGTATLLLVVSMLIARRRKKDNSWLGKHKVLGVMALVMPILGFSIFRLPGQARRLRAVHVWMGRITLLLLVTAGVSGVLM
jgi:hypothetical protein